MQRISWEIDADVVRIALAEGIWAVTESTPQTTKPEVGKNKVESLNNKFSLDCIFDLAGLK